MPTPQRVTTMPHRVPTSSQAGNQARRRLPYADGDFLSMLRRWLRGHRKEDGEANPRVVAPLNGCDVGQARQQIRVRTTRSAMHGSPLMGMELTAGATCQWLKDRAGQRGVKGWYAGPTQQRVGRRGRARAMVEGLGRAQESPSGPNSSLPAHPSTASFSFYPFVFPLSFLFFSLYSKFKFEFAQSSKLVLILNVQIEHINMDGLMFFIYIFLYFYITFSFSSLTSNLQIRVESPNLDF